MTPSSLPPILVAEDDSNDLFLLRRCLNRAGVNHPLLTFRNGEELIDFLRTEYIDGAQSSTMRRGLLFLDIKMPRLDGFDVLRWIRTQTALAGLKVIVLSGSDEPTDIKRAHELGAAQFLTKYPPPEIFAEIIATVL